MFSVYLLQYKNYRQWEKLIFFWGEGGLKELTFQTNNT